MALGGIEVFNFLLAGAFLGLLLASTIAYLRRPTPQRRDVSLMFWVLWMIMAGWALASMPAVPVVVMQATYAISGAHPWMMMRLVSHFAPRRNIAEATAIVGFVATAVSVTFWTAATMPLLLMGLLYTWFIVAELHASIVFYWAAQNSHAGLRMRLLMASWATALIVSANVIMGAWAFLPETRFVLEPIGIVITMVVVGLYVAAFLPPPGLRMLWHRAAVDDVLDGLPGAHAEPEAIEEAWSAGAGKVLDARICVVDEAARDNAESGATPTGAFVQAPFGALHVVAHLNRDVMFVDEAEELLARLAREGIRRIDESRAHRQRAEDLRRISELEKFKSGMLRNMGHELANPLSPILLQLRILARPGLDAGQERSLAMIERNVERLSRLVHEMREGSKAQEPRVVLNPSRFDLVLLLRGAVGAYQPAAAAKGLTLEGDLPDEAVIHADAVKVGQVVDNLISNSIKYSPSGRICVGLHADDGGWSLSVQDEGLGFGPEQAARLFEPYVRLHAGGAPGADGTGLGLHIVKDYIEAHGGRVVAHSPGPGQGARFDVFLPERAAPPLVSAMDRAA